MTRRTIGAEPCEMEVMTQVLLAPATYKRLAYLLTALVLGPLWFAALVAVWSVCAGLIITPFGIPALIALAYMTRGFAALARYLLDVDAEAPAFVPPRPGFWGWLRGHFGPGFWRAQAYLLIRWFAGFPIAIAVITFLAVALATLAAPAWVPFVHGGADLGIWRPHTFAQSLVGVPIGLLLLPLSVLLAEALALPFGPIAPSPPPCCPLTPTPCRSPPRGTPPAGVRPRVRVRRSRSTRRLTPSSWPFLSSSGP